MSNTQLPVPEDRDQVDLHWAREYLARANSLRNAASNEEAMKANLIHHLPLIFPGHPGWLTHHISGVEAHLHVANGNGHLSRFTDSLLGLTSIEYEPDLRRGDRFAGGYKQVKEHCAGMLNAGLPANKLVGILSDTVTWIAYSATPLHERPAGQFGTDDVELTEIGKVDATSDSEHEARNLTDFLAKHLGRKGSRPLTAQTIVSDLGVDNPFGGRHLSAVKTVVTSAFDGNPSYGNLIEELWVKFVAVAGSGAATVPFDRENYCHELYLVTLAKLICANVLANRALRSDEGELRRILSGEHFRSLGLDNLVEYDYFGWLSDPPQVAVLLPIAQAIQEDLHAYDFEQVPVEDLFGRLMAEMGKRSQRLLLGQEFTPSWLCTEMAKQLLADLPDDQAPRFVDMCCGSGAMLVAATHEYRGKLAADGHSAGDPEALRMLTECATGFDIDPLAVLLAKVNWVVANRTWLASGERVSIPVYHADSLFIGAPFVEGAYSGNELRLALHDGVEVQMPRYLIEPDRRQLFDDLLQHGYSLVRAALNEPLETSSIDAAAEAVLGAVGDLTDAQRNGARSFFEQLVAGLHSLQESGLNGLWAFILKNSYRPALAAGQFNGLIANPPWLALSKVANNPYGVVLRSLASRLGLTPPGPAHLHTELSTTFLYASIDRYLTPHAVVACILPDAVLNGYQHKPFREGAPATSPTRVRFSPSRIWRIERGTFKNEAIVVLGTKAAVTSVDEFPGGVISRLGLQEDLFKVLRRGDRVVWTDAGTGSSNQEFFSAGAFRQGADLMPRTLLFHEATPLPKGRWSVGKIDRLTGARRYLVKDAKKHKAFAIETGSVDDAFVFDALMSNHLTPFVLGGPDKIFLPFERTLPRWTAVSAQGLAADPASADVFSRIHAEIGANATAADLLQMVETDRLKLSIQIFPSSGHLVAYGAGGGIVCAASRAMSTLDPSKLVIDQTLYWLVVESEDEALYLTGCFNSAALEPLISAFQPQGQQGDRHIHTLPVLVTPRFDPSDPLHQNVVTTTRAHLQQWQALLDTHTLDERLDPNKALAARRSFLRQQLAGLSTYEEYEGACAAAYEVAPGPVATED